MTMWQFLSTLPVGLAWGILILAGLGLAGVIWLGTYTLYKGGKIKAGKVELDAPEAEDDKTAPPTGAA